MKEKIIYFLFFFFLFIEISLTLIAINITPIKLKRNVFTIQYGENISTNVTDYVFANENILKNIYLNIENVSNEVGNYKASVSYYDKELEFEIHVIDTIKPKVELKKVEWHILVDEKIYAKDIIKNVKDNSKTSVYFYNEKDQTKKKSLSFKEEGSYIERIIVEDEHGNQSAVLRIKITVGKTDSAPTIEGVSNIIIRKGEKINLTEGVIAMDVEDGDVTDSLTVSGVVDVNVPGDYYITYVAYDHRGNKTTVIRIISVE